MLWELWQSWRTPVIAPYVKKMGYLHEAIAMVSRAQRCVTPWQKHYQACQMTIQKAIQVATVRRKALIFGAGTLNDLPLKALSDAFEEVLLIDLVFLTAARKIANKYPNIHLVEHDVSESLDSIFTGKSQVCSPSRWLKDDEVGLVVSLNLITQLPLIPVRWLMHTQKLSAQQADQVGKALIYQHLYYLKAFKATACLIADRQNIETNHRTGEQEVLDPWWEIEAPKWKESWRWQVAPKGERGRDVSQTNLVGVSWL